MNNLKWITRILSLITFLAGELAEAASDGRITLRELVELAMAAAERLGFDVDTEGVDLEQLFAK